MMFPEDHRFPDLVNNSNDLRELIIYPALDDFDISLVSVDHPFSNRVLTNDLLYHLTNADICIFESSDLDPLIMTSYGIRFQTGLPCVMLAKRGEFLPFDLKSSKVIYYALDTATNIRTTVLEIRKCIGEIMKTGKLITNEFQNGEPSMKSEIPPEAKSRIHQNLSPIELRTKIENLVIDNKLKEALELLKKEKRELIDEVVIHLSRYNEIQKMKRLGTVDSRFISVEIIKLRSAILGLLHI